MSYPTKVYGLVAAAVTIMAAAVLLAWAYMEVQFQVEHERLIECIRSETMTDGALPAHTVIDANIQRCDGERLVEAPGNSKGGAPSEGGR
jgi:hypothetical protein